MNLKIKKLQSIILLQIQLLTQKVTLMKVQIVKFDAYKTSFDKTLATKTLSECINNIFDIVDISSFSNSTDLIASHLPCLAASLNKSQWEKIAM